MLLLFVQNESYFPCLNLGLGQTWHFSTSKREEVSPKICCFFKVCLQNEGQKKWNSQWTNFRKSSKSWGLPGGGFQNSEQTVIEENLSSKNNKNKNEKISLENHHHNHHHHHQQFEGREGSLNIRIPFRNYLRIHNFQDLPQEQEWF